MKKLFVVLGISALLFGFTSCNKHCVCTVTNKDGQILGERDFSDQGLNREECTSKVDEIMNDYITSAHSSDLVGLAVNCEHL